MQVATTWLVVNRSNIASYITRVIRFVVVRIVIIWIVIIAVPVIPVPRIVIKAKIVVTIIIIVAVIVAAIVAIAIAIIQYSITTVARFHAQVTVFPEFFCTLLVSILPVFSFIHPDIFITLTLR
jgi:hypothetical protein